MNLLFTIKLISDGHEATGRATVGASVVVIALSSAVAKGNRVVCAKRAGTRSRKPSHLCALQERMRTRIHQIRKVHLGPLGLITVWEGGNEDGPRLSATTTVVRNLKLRFGGRHCNGDCTSEKRGWA